MNKKISPEKNSLVNEILDISGEKIDSCIQCGKCSAGCPANEFMDILPNKIIRLLQIGDIKTLENSKSIWNCAACFTCESRCPRNVSVSKLMEALRLRLIRQQNGDRLSSNHIPKLMEDDKNIPQQAFVSAFRKFSK